MSIEPHLWVSDLGASVAWYQAVLGFEPAAWFPDEAGATWCQLQTGDTKLMLAVVPDPDALAPNQQYLAEMRARVAGSGGPLSLYLHVSDANAAYALATGSGAEPIEALWDAWWGGRQFTLSDPDGNWWTVFQDLD